MVEGKIKVFKLKKNKRPAEEVESKSQDVATISNSEVAQKKNKRPVEEVESKSQDTTQDVATTSNSEIVKKKKKRDKKKNKLETNTSTQPAEEVSNSLSKIKSENPTPVQPIEVVSKPLTKSKSKVSKSKADAEFYNSQVKLYITLPPCYAGDLSAGINEFLNSFVMKYMTMVNGIVLAHSDTRVLQSSGKILYDSPFINFWITTKLLVWRPSIGIKLAGSINLQSSDHIGLIIHNTFNASIHASDIPKGQFKWVASEGEFSEGEWINIATGEPIGKNGTLEFFVKSLNSANDVLNVTGTLSKSS